MSLFTNFNICGRNNIVLTFFSNFVEIQPLRFFCTLTGGSSALTNAGSNGNLRWTQFYYQALKSGIFISYTCSTNIIKSISAVHRYFNSCRYSAQTLQRHHYINLNIIGPGVFAAQMHKACRPIRPNAV